MEKEIRTILKVLTVLSLKQGQTGSSSTFTSQKSVRENGRIHRIHTTDRKFSTCFLGKVKSYLANRHTVSAITKPFMSIAKFCMGYATLARHHSVML